MFREVGRDSGRDSDREILGDILTVSWQKGVGPETVGKLDFEVLHREILKFHMGGVV